MLDLFSYRAHGNPADDVSREQRIDDQDGNDRDGQADINGPVFRPIHITTQRLYQHRQGVFVEGRDQDEGVEEVVPGEHKSEDTECGRSRYRQRHHDPVEDTQLTGAIDPGRVDEVLDQHRLEILFAKENTPGVGDCW